MSAAIKNDPNTSDRTWEDNAKEFGAIARGEGGWALAVLVACSVDPNPTTTPKSGATAPKEPHAQAWSSGKVSATEFAKTASVGQQAISKYLTGWAKAIEAGAPVPAASELKPSDVGTFPLPAKPFNGPDGYVKTRSGSAASGTVETTVASVIEGKNQLTQELAKSSSAMTKLIEAAAKGPKVIETVIAEMDDKSFEVLSDAITAATTPAPATITSTGVKAAVTPSAAKVATVHKAATSHIGAAIKANPKAFKEAEDAVFEVKAEKIQQKFAEKFPSKPKSVEEIEDDAALANGTATYAGVQQASSSLLWATIAGHLGGVAGQVNKVSDAIAESSTPLDQLTFDAAMEMVAEARKALDNFVIQAEFSVGQAQL